jgi:hypothetical protein
MAMLRLYTAYTAEAIAIAVASHDNTQHYKCRREKSPRVDRVSLTPELL